MKKSTLFFLVMLLSIVPLLIAMGMFQGDTPSDRVPIPQKKFAATFVDHSDIVTDCTDASIEGYTYLDGKKGGGVYTVDFERLKSIVFLFNNGELRASARLLDGSELVLNVNKDRKAFGKTKYGTFQIKLSDLKKMLIHPI